MGQPTSDSIGQGPEGGQTVSLKLEDLSHAEPILLRLGAELQVLEPADLRERIAATTGAMAALYR